MGVTTLFPPNFCPDCRGFTMEIVEYRLDDSILSQMYGLWHHVFGKIAPEFRMAKGPSILQKTSCGESPGVPPTGSYRRNRRPFPPQEMAFHGVAG